MVQNVMCKINDKCELTKINILELSGRDYHTMGKVGRRSQSSGSLAVVQKHLWHPQKPSILRGLLDDVVPSGGTLALHVQVQGMYVTNVGIIDH